MRIPNRLDSSSNITNATGQVSQHVEYMAFAETLIEEHLNTEVSPYLFNAKERDSETGLYYYGARYYNPKTSQWLSVDPLWEKFPSYSPYNFVLNNPIRLVDPDGRDVIYYNNQGDEVHRVKSETVHEMYLINSNDGGNQSHHNISHMIQGANTVQTAQMYMSMMPSEFSVATSMSMEFSGAVETSRGKDSQGRQKYIAEGSLTTIVGFENDTEVQIQSVDANSGPHGFGPIPNGDYEGSRITNTSESGMVRDGVGFKVFLSDNTELNRTQLRIHPDQVPALGSAGCIGITESSTELKSFKGNVKTFLNGYPNTPINVNVNITNNPNYNRPPNGRQNSGE